MMKKIQRKIQPQIESAAQKIGVITIMGPRQSGKTTLVKSLFPNYRYYNLEDIKLRERISLDPKQFLEANQESGVIFDEVQKYPDLISYIQVNIDEDFQPGKFILTGSENLLLSEKISQTLAGRVAIFQLLPFSISELNTSDNLKKNYLKQIRYGFYPRIYDQDLLPKELYPDYISTYIERDVRQIKNIGDLANFQRFLQLLAGRAGQLLNLSSLANDVGVTYKTIDSWLSVLEATYITFRFQPYYKNFGKRIIKSPKIYFYDTGLLCYLLGIDSEKELKTYSAIGNIFENLVIADVQKQLFNYRSSSQLYFWRDSEKNEIDLLIKNGDRLYPVEVKLGSSFSVDYLKGIKIWKDLQQHQSQSFVVYRGDEDKVLETRLKNWEQLPEMSKLLV